MSNPTQRVYAVPGLDVLAIDVVTVTAASQKISALATVDGDVKEVALVPQSDDDTVYLNVGAAATTSSMIVPGSSSADKGVVLPCSADTLGDWEMIRGATSNVAVAIVQMG